MQYYMIIFFVALAGAAIPLQGAMNSRMRLAVQSPLMGSLISFLVGAVCLGVLTIAFGRGKTADLHTLPWWTWLGGVCGAAVVTSAVVGVPRIGVGNVVMFSIVGQLTASLLMDQFGWLGVPKVAVSSTRIVGALLLFIGAILAQRK